MEKDPLPFFSHKTYKTIMATRLLGAANRGKLSSAAASLGCERSYLSRVINGKLQLTPDHAYGLSKFWNLTANEHTFFMKLVEWERSHQAAYRNALEKEVQTLRNQFNSVQTRAQRADLNADMLQAQYFSSWTYSAIHFLTSIPKYQSIESLSQRLSLPPALVSKVLENLRGQGMVDQKSGRWSYKSGEFHVPRTSPLVQLHHQNWRHRAILDAQDSENQSVHFTGVLTVSEHDRQVLKELILSFIARANAIAAPSKPETLVGLTCDLFEV